MSQLDIGEPNEAEQVADRLEVFEIAWKAVERLSGKTPDVGEVTSLCFFLVDDE